MKTRSFRTLVSALSAALILSASASAQEANSNSAATNEEIPPPYGEEGWRYNTYYLFPLTRHMKDTELRRYARYALYPLAAVVDVVQLPVGALGGLLGE